jgi:hypothetical protein
MYFPKSQITPNLYSNNDLVYKSTGLLYTGYYFKVSTGKYYTGRTPDDKPNEELIFLETTSNSSTFGTISQTAPISGYDLDLTLDVINYNNVTNNSITTPLLPTYSPVLPTQQDYQNGEFQRYFCKKTNEIQYIEINLDIFSKLKAKDPQILYSLYQPFTITWILTGSKEQVEKTNRNIVELASFRQKLPKFGEYLKFDYLKYYNQNNTTSNVLADRNSRTTKLSSAEEYLRSISGSRSL